MRVLQARIKKLFDELAIPIYPARSLSVIYMISLISQDSN